MIKNRSRHREHCYLSPLPKGVDIAVAILIRTVLLYSMTPTCQLSTVNCQHQKRPNLTGYSYKKSDPEIQDHYQINSVAMFTISYSENLLFRFFNWNPFGVEYAFLINAFVSMGAEVIPLCLGEILG